MRVGLTKGEGRREGGGLLFDCSQEDMLNEIHRRVLGGECKCNERKRASEGNERVMEVGGIVVGGGGGSSSSGNGGGVVGVSFYYYGKGRIRVQRFQRFYTFGWMANLPSLAFWRTNQIPPQQLQLRIQSALIA